MSKKNEVKLPKIRIQNFFDPTLFWFIYEDDIVPKEELHRTFQRCMNKRNSLYNTPKENSIVGVKYNDQWYRAQIKHLMEANKKTMMLVHFIDEGFFERVEQVYTLPKIFIETPPFCKKGMLHAVQSSRLDLGFQRNSLSRTGNWSAGLIQKLEDVFANPDTLITFDQKIAYGNTEIGNVNVYNAEEGHNGSLGDYLVRKSCAVIDEVAFKLDLLNELSDEAIVRKIMLQYDNSQKRQRSKSVTFREPLEEDRENRTSDRRQSAILNRSNSETRKLNYNTVRKEREYILEKAGIQSGRQSRYSKYVWHKNANEKSSNSTDTQKTYEQTINHTVRRGIVHDLDNGVGIPRKLSTSFDSDTENSIFQKKTLSDAEMDHLDAMIDEPAKKGTKKQEFDSSMEISPKLTTSKTLVRGRGSRKTDLNTGQLDMSTSFESEKKSPQGTSASFITSEKLSRLLKKKSINKSPEIPTVSKDIQRENFTITHDPILRTVTNDLAVREKLEITVNLKTSERNVDYKVTHSNTSISDRFSKLQSNFFTEIPKNTFDNTPKEQIPKNKPSNFRGSGRKINYEDFSDSTTDENIAEIHPMRKLLSKVRSSQPREKKTNSPEISQEISPTGSKSHKNTTKMDEDQNYGLFSKGRGKIINSPEITPLASEMSEQNYDLFSKGRGKKMPSSTPLYTPNNFDEKGLNISKNIPMVSKSTENTPELSTNQNYDSFSIGRGKRIQASTPLNTENSPTISKTNENTAELSVNKNQGVFSLGRGKNIATTQLNRQNLNEHNIANEDLNTHDSFDLLPANTHFSKGRGFRKASSITSSDSEVSDRNFSKLKKNTSDNKQTEILPKNVSIFQDMTSKKKLMNIKPAGMLNLTSEDERKSKASLTEEESGCSSNRKYLVRNPNRSFEKSDGEISSTSSKDNRRNSPFLDKGFNKKYKFSESLTSDGDTSFSNSENQSFDLNKSTASKSYINSASEGDSSFPKLELNKSSSSKTYAHSKKSPISTSKCVGNYQMNDQPNEEFVDTPTCRMSRLKTNHCLCGTCGKWLDTNDLIDSDAEQDNTKEEKVRKPKVIKQKYPLLKEITNEKIKLEDVYYKSVIDKFIAPKVLIHSVVSVEPWTKVGETNFHPEVVRSMFRMNYEKSHRIQSYTWCSIARGLNTFIVNGPKSGKSMAYVPPVCSEVLCAIKDLGHIDNRSGPLVLVLVPGVEVGEHIELLMCKMYQCTKDKPKIVLAAPPLTKRVRSDIENGVDILVVTPKLLLNLLKQKDTRLKRIKTVVFEEADILMKKFAEEMAAVLKVLKAITEKGSLNHGIKLILISKYWTPQIETLAKSLKRPPAICIGAHLEAALYGRVNINVKFIKGKAKNKYIECLIEESKKVLIICSTNEEIQLVKRLLIDFNPLILDEDSDIEVQKSVQGIWDAPLRLDFRVLICNDYVLNTSVFVNISDASIVIQYSLPESWTLFSKRFSQFSNHFPSPLFSYSEEDETFQMHIFIDENSKIQYGKMLKFLQRFNSELPEEIVDLYQKMINDKEKQKVIDNVEICDNIKLFGICEESDICNLRHIFDERDTINAIPKSGIIKLKLLHMHDVTHYSVRLIQHIDENNLSHNIKDRFAEIAIRLAKLSNEDYRQKIDKIEIGTICAIEESTNLFRRAKVTKILSTTSSNAPTRVQIKLLDVGAYYNILTNELYALPEKELYTIPPQAVDVFIADMGPPDKDKSWSDIARTKLQYMLKQADYEAPNCYFNGRIKLQLSNTLWVNNLILREYAPDGSLQVHKLSARSSLLWANLAEDLQGVVENLYKLCEKANIELPDYSLPVLAPIKEIQPQIKPMWAHLENNEEYTLVYFSSADNPSRFYIRICKYQSSFDDLIDDIQKAIRQPLYPTSFDVIEGRCYLAKDPLSSQYGRVIVNKIKGDIADCFFVDHGDFTSVDKTELKFLTDELILKLPFQIIECSLWGIAPKKNWHEESIDALYDFAYEPNSDLLRYLQIKVIEKSVPDITRGTKYSVILIDTVEENNIVNQLFVDKKLAVKIIEDDFATLVDFEKLRADNVGISDDFDEGDGDKEYIFEDIQSFREKFEEKIDNKEEYIEEIKRDSQKDDSEESLDIQMFDPLQFLREGFMDFSHKPFISASTTETQDNNLIVPMRSSTSTEYSTPSAVWSQTSTHISIKIKLTGVTNYELFITRQKFLLFSTTLNDVFFKLNLTLFSKVESTFDHEAKGFHVYIKLKKLVEGDWENLYSTKQKLRNITYDPDFIYEKNKVQEKVFIPFLFDEEDKPKFIYEYGSDNEYDDESSAHSYDEDDD